MVDHTAKPPHGVVFKKWANAAMRAIPGIAVTTCHNYEIFKPFKFGCTKCPQVRPLGVRKKSRKAHPCAPSFGLPCVQKAGFAATWCERGVRGTRDCAYAEAD